MWSDLLLNVHYSSYCMATFEIELLYFFVVAKKVTHTGSFTQKCKFCHLLSHKLFQTCMSLFLLYNIKKHTHLSNVSNKQLMGPIDFRSMDNNTMEVMET